MLITNGTIHQRGMRRRTVQRQVSFGPMTLRVVTIVIFAMAAFIALAQSTASATKNYEVTQLSNERDDLAKKVGDLELEKTRHETLKSIMAEVGAATPSPTPQLEEPKQINYLPGDETVEINQAVATTSLR